MLWKKFMSDGSVYIGKPSLKQLVELYKVEISNITDPIAIETLQSVIEDLESLYDIIKEDE